MADEKKPESKEVKPEGGFWFSHPDPFVEFVWMMLSLLVLVYLANTIIANLNSGGALSSQFGGASLKETLLALFWKLFSYIKIISIILSLLLIAAVVYLYKKIVFLRREEAKLYQVENVSNKVTGELKNPQWEKILRHTDSLNESDWRLAILEADIMLDTLLDNMGLPGETMGDKLKAVEKSDFLTIDNAWEGHKVRNQIAHEGATFTLNQHETKRVIDLYRSVFEEFKII